ncbi:DUF6090 family protein [Spirosoma soli]|uniref:DUF6090 family protein n=1 Tax=Spirosoma soli TaxID=1770529 RepID=A0ABW5MAW6_9BACT
METEPNLPPADQPSAGLHRFSSLVREKWPEYILEIVTIILSITISFAFDEWKDERSKQQTQQAYLKSLYNNFQTDVIQLNEVLAETKQIIAKTQRLQQANLSSVSNQQFLTDIKFITKRPRFIAEDATFLDLTSTGNLRLLDDFGLKNALFDYYKHYQSIQLVEAAELEFTNTIIGPYFIKNLPLTTTATNSNNFNAASIAASFEFQNCVLIRQATRRELQEDYNVALDKARRLEAPLKKQIN